MPQTQSIHQLLALLPESQFDHFLRQLSPEALQALQTLETGATHLTDTVTTEIANAVWVCLEAD